jgi:omega-6 fatty acid desaturase (delta-12 desaturase)
MHTTADMSEAQAASAIPRLSSGPVDWTARLAPYQQPDVRRSVVQLSATVCAFLLLWAAMVISLEYGYWLTLAIAVPAAMCLVRLFLIQHDCAHRAFFPSPAANDRLGFLLGLLTLTPHQHWRRTHAVHHASSGNLDRRGLGDIGTLTVREYAGLTRMKKLAYRLYRNPIVLFGVGPTFQFVVRHRFCTPELRSARRERASVHATNVGLVALLGATAALVGVERFVLVHAPIVVLASSIGVWFFYVQHQFEETYWDDADRWDYLDAGLRGSSHYALPRFLERLTCRIGLHHVHHLNARIPNYRLRECLDAQPLLQRATQITLLQSFKCASLKLWDEEERRLVGYRHARRDVPSGRSAISS